MTSEKEKGVQALVAMNSNMAAREDTHHRRMPMFTLSQVDRYISKVGSSIVNHTCHVSTFFRKKCCPSYLLLVV